MKVVAQLKIVYKQRVLEILNGDLYDRKSMKQIQ